MSPVSPNTIARLRPPRAVLRGDHSWVLQTALERRGLGPVAGVDEAGRGACAGPLVVAACVLRANDAARLPELTDSKLLTPVARERVYEQILRYALDHAVVVITPQEIDALGIHVMNIEGMRRAVAGLTYVPGYVLTDGFTIPGLPAPSMPVVKGDQVAACVAAASVLAKVTRDRLMTQMHAQFPVYGFDVHKGYSTAEHCSALQAHGPSAIHRWSYTNVANSASDHGVYPPHKVMLTAAALNSALSLALDSAPNPTLDEPFDADLNATLDPRDIEIGDNGQVRIEQRAQSRGGTRTS